MEGLILGVYKAHEIQGFQNIIGSVLKSKFCFIYCHSINQNSVSYRWAPIDNAFTEA